MKYDGFIIYSDFDGTLTNQEHVVSRENIEAISYFIENGGIFSLATGRQYNDLIDGTGCMSIPVNAPLILANGAEIYDTVNGIWIKQYIMPDSIKTVISKIYNNWPDIGLSIHTTRGEHNYRYNEILKDSINEELWLEKQGHIEDLDALSGTILMVNVFGDGNVLNEIRGQIEGKYDREVTCTESYPNFINITPKGVSKGEALNYLKYHEFAQKSDFTIIALGDSENDKELLETVDFACAMGNCSPKLYHSVDIILKDNNYPSIPQVLSYIDAGKVSHKSKGEVS